MSEERQETTAPRGFTLVELPVVSERKRKAFTLVELLVVIGIIAVLIGVLLPALSAARRQANTVKCLANLRSLGQAYLLYANDNRDAFPVVRSDTPDVNGTPQNVQNTYYTDMLMKYVSKTGKMNFQIGTDTAAFDQTRASVLWGCPQWDGWYGTGTTYIGGRSIFEAGYAMNMFPTAEANYPADPTVMPPGTETQMRSTVITVEGVNCVGHFYKRAQWTHSAERMLMCDANLWVLLFRATDSSHTIPAQTAVRAAQDGTPGGNQIDRYRHGKYPRVVGSIYSLAGGQQKFNVVYVDGHAATLTDVKDGYRAVRMRAP
jgi:prepilin-type N-terminal cleavage/methylation domain-containing protein/prepilin-type processing-associated H-X9-DG protein